MKVRNGFVSNSSSSSFVVAFSKVPANAQELAKMLFGDDADYPNPYIWEDSTPSWPVSEIAQIVFSEMSSEATDEELKESVRGAWLEGAPDYDDFGNKLEDSDHVDWDTIDWDAYHQASTRHADKTLEKFMAANPGCKFFRFSYSDNDGEQQTALEHGPLFDRLPHIRCSHH